MSRQLAILGTMVFSLPAFAATPIDLAKQPASFLANKSLVASSIQLKETSRNADRKNTLHVRVLQTYRGYPVWGGDSVVHIPEAGRAVGDFTSLITAKTFMNGTAYQGLNQDLDGTSNVVFSDEQSQKAIAHVLGLKPELADHAANIKHKKAELLVYIDDANKAHWAYKVSFDVLPAAAIKRQKPTYLIDAEDFSVFQSWNDLKSFDEQPELVRAGGFGGNHKTGKKTFDGLEGNQPWFTVTRYAETNQCRMENEFVTLYNLSNYSPMTFSCTETDPEHNNIYWNADHDRVKTTWSPANDVLFGAEVTRQMFNEWYDMPVLTQDGKPMRLVAKVHSGDVNAYWSNNSVMFGDSLGSNTFNPFTQLDTVAHEINHGFTEQHSDLNYYSQSGGLNEAFSDMAGIAAEFYAYGHTEFLVGLGDVKAEGKSLRYMDKPSKDCGLREPGNRCSIDTISQYRYGLDVHYSSGLFNHVYYVLANTSGWDAKKAFDVMVTANMNYWVSNTNFRSAACDVVKAADDWDYNRDDVIAAFETVGIDDCK